ncbi:hypothetical protein [Novosphingobium album (ex Hu et al. 2023)]|uniref:Secreted protein n=1 Tax=Novosphingobium album (ex Hu et al. 2023) TaxID=2930093 RepID=A0ABT0AWM7_9SPHN|nr:hypothetical protein [Novosphingobium album (ex Hu et al. 2023)]MCJ2177236.1 hypothetical protein [Novosphingobium album (ex Hu et al. 2023)]
MSRSYLAALVAVIMATQPARARAGEQDAPPAEPYLQLMACRAISDASERLACYDRQTAAFEEATRRREIVISDKNAVKAARRGLFGFTAPIGKLMGFGGDDDEAEEIKEIESTVTGARHTSNGWRLELEDGSTWEQNDTRDFVLSPKPGNPVKITRGVLGTYFVSVKGQRAVKMRRIN